MQLIQDGAAIGGRYVVLARLGAGAMGVVYAAWDRELARRVAVKLLKPGEEAARFQREAQALAKLKHANVVTVHDVGRDEHGLYIAMELVEGASLRRWLEAGRRTAAEVRAVFVAAGRGLAAAHAAGLVHRDFKPDNVLVGDDGSVRVADFGLVVLAGEAHDALHASLSPETYAPDSMTETGVVVGTPRYMPPEQQEARSPDARGDQYSFCVAMWEALYGEHPTVSGAKTVPPAVGRVPARWRAALKRGLESDRERRHPSMDALLAELVREPPLARWIVAAAAAAVLASAGWVGWRQSDEPRRACQAEAAAAAPLTGADRAALRAGLARVGAPAAAENALRALDAYAADLMKMTGESCEATRVRAAQSAEVQTLRAQCLGERRHALRLVTDDLARADAALARRSVEAVLALPAIAECADVEALRAPTRVPADPRLRPPVAALRGELERIRVLVDSGRGAAAQVPAGAAVVAAAGLGFAPLRADALTSLGATYSVQEKYVLATRTLEDAVYAAQAAGHDATLTRAATLLAHAAIYAGRPAAEPRSWMRLAQATLARLPASATVDALASEIDVQLADLEGSEGRVTEALQHARRALAAHEREGASRVLFLALQTLASVLEEAGDLDGSDAAYHRALAVAVVLGLADDDIALIHDGLGINAGRRERWDEARACFARALALATPGGYGAARFISNRAIVDMYTDHLDEALAGFRSARAMVTALVGPKNPRLAGYYMNEGTVLRNQDKLDEARAAYEEGLAAAEAGDPEGPLAASLLRRIAAVLVEQGKLPEARVLADRAVALVERREPDGLEMTRTLIVAAMARRDSPAGSLPFFERALAGLEAHEAGPTEIASMLSDMGEAQLATGDRTGAHASLERAESLDREQMTAGAIRALARLRKP